MMLTERRTLRFAPAWPLHLRGEGGRGTSVLALRSTSGHHVEKQRQELPGGNI